MIPLSYETHEPFHRSRELSNNNGGIVIAFSVCLVCWCQKRKISLAFGQTSQQRGERPEMYTQNYCHYPQQHCIGGQSQAKHSVNATEEAKSKLGSVAVNRKEKPEEKSNRKGTPSPSSTVHLVSATGRNDCRRMWGKVVAYDAYKCLSFIMNRLIWTKVNEGKVVVFEFYAK